MTTLHGRAREIVRNRKLGEDIQELRKRIEILEDEK